MLANSIINYESILPFAIFGLFAAAAWWMLEAFAGGRGRAEERLEDMRNPTRRKRLIDESSSIKESSAVTKLLEKASPALSKPLQPQDEESQGKLKQRLTCGGFRSESATAIFLCLKFVGLLIGLFLFGGPVLLMSGANQDSLIRVVMVSGLLFFLPDMLLWFLTKRRKDAIFFGLPDALDLMVVCVEAGLGLDQAMRKVSEEMKKTFRVIADEFALCNFHLQMGRARSEVLKDLGMRTGVEDVRSLAAILIQADKFGSSIAQALRVQSNSMRTRRSQLAEEKAAKTAVKLIFPLVIFIFPGIFVILVGPAAITMVREMFPAMNGG